MKFQDEKRFSKHSDNQPESKSLGVLLLRLVFSIYLAITMVITAIQMYNEYRFEKEAVQSNLLTYRKIYSDSVSTALWNLDLDQLNATLDGAQELFDIAGILLFDNDGEVIYHNGAAPTDPETAKNNQQDKNRLFFHAFDITYSDNLIGTLYLYSSEELVFEKVKYNFLFILVNAVIKTVALWLVFLWAFKRYLVDALDKFIARMQSTEFETLDQQHTPDYNDYLLHSTELEALDNVFFDLKQRLRQSKDKLESLNSQLEATVQKRTELLHRQQHLMENMSQQGRIGAWEYDLDSNCTTWSPTLRKLLEVDQSFKASLNALGSFFSPEQRETLKQLEERARQYGTPWKQQFLLTDNRGKERWVASTGEAEFEEGRCKRLFGSIQDIDEQIQTQNQLKEARQKAEAADQLKSEFLSNMSHEIRTPLNGIIGMLNVMINDGEYASRGRELQIALDSATSLLHMLNDILDFSLIESGHLELHSSIFSPRALLQNQAELWRARAREKNLDLKLDIEQVHFEQIRSDEQRLNQILSNLLNNAIKYSQAGTITVLARSTHQQDRPWMQIEVIDQGPGIHEARLSTIFERFAQPLQDKQHTSGGAGLGLAIVKELAQLMGGRIEVSSIVGEGSSFILSIPVGLPPKNESPYSGDLDSSNTKPPIFQHQEHILVVEDNVVNQSVAKAMLEQSGFNVSLSSDGAEALAYLNQTEQNVDLVLMDCLMPVLDGYQAARAIRAGEAGERNKDIPIVALTANAMKGDREKCLEAGMDDYLSKPITSAVLVSKLEQWLKSSRTTI